MADFDDQVLSRDLNICVKQFLKSCEAASIQVYRIKPAALASLKKKKKGQTLILQIKQAIFILLLKKSHLFLHYNLFRKLNSSQHHTKRRKGGREHLEANRLLRCSGDGLPIHCNRLKGCSETGRCLQQEQ